MPADAAPLDPAAAAPKRRPRLPALDAARALGVVAMVFGHTIDAVLSVEGRAAPAVAAYWKARGLTAPLFLIVSGWAVMVAIRRSGARGLAVPAGRLPRVLLLLAVGYGLRWPGWGIDALAAGNPDVWAHLLAFDALHTIAVALLATALVLALPLSARERALALALLAVLAITLGLLAPAPLPPGPDAHPRRLVLLALWQAVGGTSTFPLFPWCGYFFAGALLGLASEAEPAVRRRRVRVQVALGAALVLATFWTGVGTMPPGDPRLVAFRIGVVLLVLAALGRVPERLAARVAPLGRASLGVYAIHLAVVWGWSTFDGLARRIGPRLSFLEAAAVALLVLAGSFAAQVALSSGWRALRAGARRIAERGGALEGG